MKPMVGLVEWAAEAMHIVRGDNDGGDGTRGRKRVRACSDMVRERKVDRVSVGAKANMVLERS